MIKCSFEVPIAHLEFVEPYVDFHFCIATSLLRHPEMMAYYKKAAETSMVMLDNGAYEAHASGAEPVPLTAQELLMLAIELRPDVVWAPDKLFDRDVTERLSNEFWDLFHHYKQKNPDSPLKYTRLGFIPQGRTADEIVDSWLTWNWKWDWIGLSFLNDRAAVLKLIPSRTLRISRVHMLGLQDMKEMATWPHCIQHVDTSKPIKAALFNKRTEYLRRGEGLLLPTDRITDEQLPLLKNNLEEFRRACNI